MGTLKCVGGWDGGPTKTDFPDPRALVDPQWRIGDRDAIVGYLKEGVRLTGYFGYSYCRFECGIRSSLMGSFDVTDGQWVWPEGLAHYVEKHFVRLPDEFVADMASRAFAVPILSIDPNVMGNSENYPYDWEFWRVWRRPS